MVRLVLLILSLKKNPAAGHEAVRGWKKGKKVFFSIFLVEFSEFNALPKEEPSLVLVFCY